MGIGGVGILGVCGSRMMLGCRVVRSGVGGDWDGEGRGKEQEGRVGEEGARGAEWGRGAEGSNVEGRHGG